MPGLNITKIVSPVSKWCLHYSFLARISLNTPIYQKVCAKYFICPPLQGACILRDTGIKFFEIEYRIFKFLKNISSLFVIAKSSYRYIRPPLDNLVTLVFLIRSLFIATIIFAILLNWFRFFVDTVHMTDIFSFF